MFKTINKSMFKTIAVILTATISVSMGYYFPFQGNAVGNDVKLETEISVSGIDKENLQLHNAETKSLSCDDMLVDPYQELYKNNDLDSLRHVRISFTNKEEYNFLAKSFKERGIPVITKGEDFFSTTWRKNEVDHLVRELESKGFKIVEANEKDLQKRIIKGQTPEGCDHSKVLELMPDVWPESYVAPFILGRAFDYQIDILKNAGINITIIENYPQISPKVKHNNPNIMDGY